MKNGRFLFYIAEGGLILFDPTIYENLKVVIEGAIYDLDLGKRINITNRIDRIELSLMSRYYALQFELLDHSSVSAELSISAHVSDFASEILEQEDIERGCKLEIHFHTAVDDVVLDCNTIHRKLHEIWGNEHVIDQEIWYQYNQAVPPKYQNKITIHFQQKMTENHIDDIHRLIEHVLQSLHSLST
jgi:hypothetical protein